MSSIKSTKVKVVDQQIITKIYKKIDQLKNAKIIILGDVGLDNYLIGNVHRISPEAPVPILEVEKEEYRLGMSANVAQNISALKSEPYLISVIGKDIIAFTLKKLLKKQRVNSNFLVTDNNRPTTRKTRILAGPNHIVRVDQELRQYISSKVNQKIIQNIRQLIKECQGIIIQDYGKGVVNASLVQQVISIAKKNKKIVIVDPHRTTPLSFYKKADIIKPNIEETISLLKVNYDEYRRNPQKIYQYGEMLLKKTSSQYSIITCGKEGMLIFSKKQIIKVPTFAQQVYDVTGAGDSVIATLACALFSGFNMEEASIIANLAAGFVVGKIGCATCSLEELKSIMEFYSTS